MMDFIKSALSEFKESPADFLNIIIGGIGCFISLFLFAKDIFCNRKNIDITIFSCHSGENIAYFSMMIENKSHLPISITGISLVQECKKTKCVTIPQFVCEQKHHEGKNVVDRKYHYSTAIPIKLDPLGAESCLVLFEDLQAKIEADSTNLNLEIYTNRGKPLKKKPQLPLDWASRNRIP